MTDIGLLPGDYVPIERPHDMSPTSFIDPDLIDPTLDEVAFATQVVDLLLKAPPADGKFMVWRPQDARVPRMDYPPDNERMWLIAHLLGGHGIYFAGQDCAANFGRLCDFRETRANLAKLKYGKAANRAMRRLERSKQKAKGDPDIWYQQCRKALPEPADFDFSLPDKEFAEQVASKFLRAFNAAGWSVHFGHIKGAPPFPKPVYPAGWLTTHEFVVAHLLAGGAMVVTPRSKELGEMVMGTLSEIRSHVAKAKATGAPIIGLPEESL